MGVRVSNAYQEYRTIRRADSSISREQAFEDAVRKYGIGGKGVNDLQETIEIRDIGDRVGDAFGEYEEMRRTDSSVPQEKTFEEVVKKYGLEGVGVKALRDVIEGRGQMSDDERSDQKEERKIKEDKEEARQQAITKRGTNQELLKKNGGSSRRVENAPEGKRWTSWDNPRTNSAFIVRGNGDVWEIPVGQSYNFNYQDKTNPIWKRWQGRTNGWIDATGEDIQTSPRSREPVQLIEQTANPAPRSEPVPDRKPEGTETSIFTKKFIQQPDGTYSHVMQGGKWNPVNVGQNYGATNEEGLKGNIVFKEGMKEFNFFPSKKSSTESPPVPPLSSELPPGGPEKKLGIDEAVLNRWGEAFVKRLLKDKSGKEGERGVPVEVVRDSLEDDLQAMFGERDAQPVYDSVRKVVVRHGQPILMVAVERILKQSRVRNAVQIEEIKGVFEDLAQGHRPDAAEIRLMRPLGGNVRFRQMVKKLPSTLDQWRAEEDEDFSTEMASLVDEDARKVGWLSKKEKHLVDAKELKKAILAAVVSCKTRRDVERMLKRPLTRVPRDLQEEVIDKVNFYINGSVSDMGSLAWRMMENVRMGYNT